MGRGRGKTVKQTQKGQEEAEPTSKKDEERRKEENVIEKGRRYLEMTGEKCKRRRERRR
jgi:hypothetical protein